MYSLSKPLAALFVATMAFLMLGSVWDTKSLFGGLEQVGQLALSAAMVVATTALAVFVLPMVAPDVGDFVKGIRRAHKTGRRRPTPWDDFAPITGILGLLLLIVLVVGGLSWLPQTQAAAGPPMSAAPPLSYWLLLAAAALLLAHYGLALQYMLFAHGRKATVFFAFYLFLVWLVPLLVSSIFSCAGQTETALVAASPSPIASLGLAIDGTKLVQLTISFATGIILLVVFGGLMVKTQRMAREVAGPRHTAEGIQLGGTNALA
jgi:hypothetical protein